MDYDNAIILLNNDGSISTVSSDAIDEKTRKNSGVSYVVINVGLELPEYLIIPRERFIRNFKEAQFEFDYNVSAYIEGSANNSDRKHCSFDCKTVIDFYRTCHSILKLQASYNIMFDCYNPVYVDAILTNFWFRIKTKKTCESINIEGEAEGDEKHEVAFVMRTINYAVYGDAEKYVIPERMDCLPYIDIENARWCLDEFKRKSGMRSIFQPYFLCTSFMDYEDIKALYKLEYIDFLYSTYILIPQNPLPYGEKITSSNIHDYDGYFIELLYTNESGHYRHRSEIINSVLALISNAAHIFMSMKISDEIAYGDMQTHGILTISYKVTKPDKKNPSHMYYYDITEDKLNHNVNLYSDFVKHIKKHYKRYIKEEE